MHRAVVVPAIGLLVYIVYLVINSILRARHYAQKARLLGCKPPFSIDGLDPFGIKNARNMLKADSQGRLPDYLLNRIETLQADKGPAATTIMGRAPPGRRGYFTTEPENIKAILAARFHDFSLGEARSSNLQALLGVGIFTSDGERWSHSRALLRPQFSRGQVSDLSIEEEHVQALLAVVERSNNPSTGWHDEIDLQPLFFNLTLDTATQFLFGESADTQLALLGQGNTTRPGEIDFAKEFDLSQRLVARATRMGDLWWLGHTKEFKRSTKLVHEFVDKYVRLALEQPIGEKQETTERYIFLRALAQQERDPIALRSQLLNILLAGRDTTASLLGWLFLLLADPQYNHVFNKLRATVTEEFGTFEHPRKITFETLKSCQYLQWCLNEALRLFPVVPVNTRMAEVDTVLPTGGGEDGKSPILIPSGSRVAYSVYVMHRRKDLWGADAAKFRPDRWDGRRHGWEYLPFNGGPRICVGQNFALTEAGYVAVRLLQRFDRIEGGSTDDAKHNLTLTTCPAQGVKVRLHRKAA